MASGRGNSREKRRRRVGRQSTGSGLPPATAQVTAHYPGVYGVEASLYLRGRVDPTPGTTADLCLQASTTLPARSEAQFRAR